MGSSPRKGLLFLLTGTIGAQALNLIALPFLSRLYTPAEYGFFSVALAITSVIAPVAGLRFETAVMLPERLEESRALTFVGVASIGMISLVCGFAFYFIFESGSFELDHSSSIALWITLLTFFTALFTLLGQIALREQQYALVARRSFFQSFFTVMSQALLGVLAKTSYGLLIGSAIGRLSGILAVLRVTQKYLKPPSVSEIKKAIKKHWRFPLVFTPSSLLNAIGLHAPLIYFTVVYGASLGGQLGMAERIMAVPVGVVGAAVAQAVDAEVSRLIRERVTGYSKLYLRFSGILGALGLLLLLGAVLSAHLLVPFVLGEQWGLAGEIVQVLSVMAAMRLVATPLSRFIVLFEKSFATISLDAFRIIAVGFSIYLSSFMSLTFSVAVTVVYCSLAFTYFITWIYGLYLVINREKGFK